MPESLKEWIEFYISHGLRPLPIYSVEEKCKHRPYKPELDCRGQCWGKVPIQEHWPDKEIFTTADFLENSNLALIMGRQLDGRWFVGFDIDGELDLKEFLQLPETLECTTGRGRHLIYEVPADTPLGNWTDILLTRSEQFGYKWDYKGALDIKYCRGAMVSPPSISKSGLVYKWKEWRKPSMLPHSEIIYLIRKRKYAHPNVKRYTKWSLEPSHKNKQP